MRKKRRKGRVTTETFVEDEIVHLRGLDLKGLRARWQSVLQRPPPDHLPRHLLFAIIAYRIQADRFGDLDHETRQECQLPFGENIFRRLCQREQAEGKVTNPRRIAADSVHFAM